MNYKITFHLDTFTPQFPIYIFSLLMFCIVLNFRFVSFDYQLETSELQSKTTKAQESETDVLCQFISQL